MMFTLLSKSRWVPTGNECSVMAGPVGGQGVQPLGMEFGGAGNRDVTFHVVSVRSLKAPK